MPRRQHTWGTKTSSLQGVLSHQPHYLLRRPLHQRGSKLWAAGLTTSGAISCMIPSKCRDSPRRNKNLLRPQTDRYNRVFGGLGGFRYRESRWEGGRGRFLSRSASYVRGGSAESSQPGSKGQPYLCKPELAIKYRREESAVLSRFCLLEAENCSVRRVFKAHSWRRRGRLRRCRAATTEDGAFPSPPICPRHHLERQRGASAGTPNTKWSARTCSNINGGTRYLLQWVMSVRCLMLVTRDKIKLSRQC